MFGKLASWQQNKHILMLNTQNQQRMQTKGMFGVLYPIINFSQNGNMWPFWIKPFKCIYTMFFLFFVIQVMLCVTTIMAIVRSCALINFKVCMQCSYMYMKKKKKENGWWITGQHTCPLVYIVFPVRSDVSSYKGASCCRYQSILRSLLPTQPIIIC